MRSGVRAPPNDLGSVPSSGSNSLGDLGKVLFSQGFGSCYVKKESRPDHQKGPFSFWAAERVGRGSGSWPQGQEEAAHIHVASPHLPAPLPRSDVALSPFTTGRLSAGKMLHATFPSGTE